MSFGGGLKFGIINILGNFGTVFVDQSYWQSAIAAKPASTHKGYLLGGLVWFTIPFALAASFGFAGVAFDLTINVGEAGSGFVPPAGARRSVHGMLLLLLSLSLSSLSLSRSTARFCTSRVWSPQSQFIIFTACSIFS